MWFTVPVMFTRRSLPVGEPSGGFYQQIRQHYSEWGKMYAHLLFASLFASNLCANQRPVFRNLWHPAVNTSHFAPLKEPEHSEWTLNTVPSCYSRLHSADIRHVMSSHVYCLLVLIQWPQPALIAILSLIDIWSRPLTSLDIKVRFDNKQRPYLLHDVFSKARQCEWVEKWVWVEDHSHDFTPSLDVDLTCQDKTCCTSLHLGLERCSVHRMSW